MVKPANVVRPIDTTGRVVLPKKLIKDILKARLDEHISVEFFYTDDSIIIKRFQHSCSFCDCRDNLKEYKGLKICPDCLEQIKEL